MNILIIQSSADRRGHFGVYTTNLCQELVKRGNTVTLFTNKVFPEKFLKNEKPNFSIIEYKNGKYPASHFDDVKKKSALSYTYLYLRNSFVILRAGLRYAHKKNFDVVHIMDSEYGIVSILVRLYRKGLKKVTLLINAPNFSYGEFTGPVYLKLYKELQRRLIQPVFGKKINGIVTIGEFHKRELRKQFSLPESFPIAVIYDGALLPNVFVEKQEARKKVGIDYQGELLLLFGVIRNDKGIEFLFEALSYVTKEVKLLIVGAAADYTEEEIKALIKKWGIEEKVLLRLGYVENNDIPNYFFSSDALVLPYVKLYRGGSGPLLKEAAIYKVPAIVSDVSEMALLVKKHQMGIIAEPENAASLSHAITTFITLPAGEREQMKKRAFAAASTWAKMAEYHEAFYENI